MRGPVPESLILSTIGRDDNVLTSLLYPRFREKPKLPSCDPSRPHALVRPDRMHGPHCEMMEQRAERRLRAMGTCHNIGPESLN
jgi:hypothetical protein